MGQTTEQSRGRKKMRVRFGRLHTYTSADENINIVNPVREDAFFRQPRNRAPHEDPELRSFFAN